MIRQGKAMYTPTTHQVSLPCILPVDKIHSENIDDIDKVFSTKTRSARQIWSELTQKLSGDTRLTVEDVIQLKEELGLYVGTLSKGMYTGYAEQVIMSRCL
ncbi:MAG: hypothetical protein NZT61_04845, partial [Deltaproteobacteria bacterium]|nr:hypothetical protein [Deltaproteobacteria bacterium]